MIAIGTFLREKLVHHPYSSIAWPIVSSPLYFRGGVTPVGSGTCATFSVIDTRL
jgi:hypothetical protein